MTSLYQPTDGSASTAATGRSATPSDAFLVRGEGISCHRGGRRIFGNIDIALSAGETLLLRGANGAGKSTLIRLVAGLLPLAAGSLHADSSRTMSDENLALDADAPLRDALDFWARMDGAGPDRLDAALSAMELSPIAHVPVRMLSTGQRKRANIARVIASEAKLWLLDEPGNGLDTASLALLGQAIQAHLADGGAIIAASHFDLPVGFTHWIDLDRIAS